MRIPRTTQQAVDLLHSGCEQCLSCLNELIGIHIEMDPVTRLVRLDDEEIVYRLRKVLLHIKSVVSWQLDTEVMHVLAPELRAAEEQIDMIWKKVPKERLKELVPSDGSSEVGMRGGPFQPGKDILSSYVHPAPQRLLLAREHGGLGNVDEVRYYIHLFLLLGNVAFRYAVSLDFLSQILNGAKEGQLVSVIEKLREEFGSLSSEDCFRFVARKDREVTGIR